MSLLFIYYLLILNTYNNIHKEEYIKTDNSWFEFNFPSEFKIIPFYNSIEPIRIKNGHFVGEKSGMRIRFFGTTIGWDFLKGSDSVIIKAVKYMRSQGVNCVRIHPPGIWNTQSHSFNKRKIERLDYLIKVLNENGIYYSFYSPIYCIYSIKEGLPLTLFKGKALLDKRLIEETKIFWDSLLNHKNKYTEIRYVDDSALAFLIMSNENSVSKLWYQDGGKEILKHYWGEYLIEKEISYFELPKDNKDNTFLTFLKFAAEKDSIYFSEIKRFLKILGVKVPIACTNEPYSYYEQRAFYKISDFMAVHTYGYYALGKEGEWVKNESHLIWRNESPWDFPARMFTVNYSNKPVIVDEWNKGYPVDSRIEASIIVPLLASLYDYDGVFYFSFFAHADYIKKWKEYSSFFMTSLEQPFSIQSVFLPNVSFAFKYFLIPSHRNSQVLDISKSEDFFKEQFNYRFNPFPDIFKQIFYLRRVIFSFDQGESIKFLKDSFQPTNEINTTHLNWNYREGYFVIDAEKFIGFVGNFNDRYCSKNFIISGSSDFFALTIVPIDGRKIKYSKKILITLGSDAVNVGDKIYVPFNFNNLIPKRYWFPSKRDQLNMKRIPASSFLKPVNVKLSLKHFKQKNIKCFSLDSKGEIIEEVSLLWDDDFLILQLNMNIHKTPYFIIKLGGP